MRKNRAFVTDSPPLDPDLDAPDGAAPATDECTPSSKCASPDAPGAESLMTPGGPSTTGGFDSADSGPALIPPVASCGGPGLPACNDAGAVECGSSNLPPRSCGNCSVVCSATELCSALGCVQPGATPAFVSGASIADFEFDSVGSLYLTGSFAEPVDFGVGVVDPGGAANIFIAKYSSAGAVEWVQTFGIDTFGALSTGSTGIALVLDPQTDSVLVTGELRGAVDFGGGLIGDPASDVTEVTRLPGNVFIAGYTATGGFLWSTVYRSSIEVGINQGTAIAVAGDTVYVAGTGVRGLDLGNGSIGNLQDNRYLFVAGIDKESGATRWSKGMPYEGIPSDPGFGQITGLVVDGASRLYVSGWWRGALDLDAGLTSSGREIVNSNIFLADSGFIASYTGSSGLLRWVRIQTDGNFTHTNAIAADGKGNLYATGGFVSSIDFGGGERPGDTADNKSFVVSYDGDGNHRFDRVLGGVNNRTITTTTGIAASEDGFYVSGYFTGALLIEGLPIASARPGAAQPSSTDALLVSYDATGEFRWARPFGTTQADLTLRAKIAGGEPVFGMQPQGTLDIDGRVIEPLSARTSVLVRVTEAN